MDMETVLESVAEAIRQSRRNYLNGLALSSVIVIEENNILELRIIEDGKPRVFVLAFSERENVVDNQIIGVNKFHEEIIKDFKDSK